MPLASQKRVEGSPDSVAIRSRFGRNRSQSVAIRSAEYRRQGAKTAKNVAKNGTDFGAWRRVVSRRSAEYRRQGAKTAKNVAKNGTDFGAWRRWPTQKKPDHLIGKSGLMLLLLCIASLTFC